MEKKYQSDIKIIKEVHEKHKSYGYRWINHFIWNLYGIYYTDNYVHRICEYEDIKYQGKHYQWKKPGEEQYKFNNLIWNGWSKMNKPLQVIVSDMTSFWANKTYYELTLYFDVWNKEELFIDFDLKHCKDLPRLIKEYIYYYNNGRASYALNYKTPIQLKIESGF